MPYQVTRRFEEALCEYTGAKYAVALNSCTAALLLCMEWFKPLIVSIPKHTYISVPQVIIRNGAKVKWRDEEWTGAYRLEPLPVWDYARRFSSGMYVPGEFQCVSFAAAKILGIEQGGAILHDDPIVDSWFRRMRFDGRTEGKPTEDITEVGHHVIMLPSIAAQALLRLYHLPKHNPDMPGCPYPDLSQVEVFK